VAIVSGPTARYVDESAFRGVLSDALNAAKLSPLTVSQATRHSFGTQ